MEELDLKELFKIFWAKKVQIVLIILIKQWLTFFLQFVKLFKN